MGPSALETLMAYREFPPLTDDVRLGPELGGQLVDAGRFWTIERVIDDFIASVLPGRQNAGERYRIRIVARAVAYFALNCRFEMQGLDDEHIAETLDAMIKLWSLPEGARRRDLEAELDPAIVDHIDMIRKYRDGTITPKWEKR